MTDKSKPFELFTPEDFEQLTHWGATPEYVNAVNSLTKEQELLLVRAHESLFKMCSMIANEKLQQWLSEMPEAWFLLDRGIEPIKDK